MINWLKLLIEKYFGKKKSISLLILLDVRNGHQYLVQLS